jgi:hypothetical protein
VQLDASSSQTGPKSLGIHGSRYQLMADLNLHLRGSDELETWESRQYRWTRVRARREPKVFAALAHRRPVTVQLSLPHQHSRNNVQKETKRLQLLLLLAMPNCNESVVLTRAICPLMRQLSLAEYMQHGMWLVLFGKGQKDCSVCCCHCCLPCRMEIVMKLLYLLSYMFDEMISFAQV